MSSKKQLYLSGWLVHILTASGAIFCIFSLIFIHKYQWIKAIWALTGCLLIDSIDGTLARKYQVKRNIPQIDGALLDNLIDFVAYVIVPCFFIYLKKFVEDPWSIPVISMIIIASSYQFAHTNAKTKDNFFRGFPCFWNFTIFYMLVVNGSKLFNLSIFLLLIFLVFVPIKYLYISRMDHVTNSKTLKYFIYLTTFAFASTSLHLLVFYPYRSSFCFIYSFIYIFSYLFFSIYRTIKPLHKATI